MEVIFSLSLGLERAVHGLLLERRKYIISGMREHDYLARGQSTCFQWIDELNHPRSSIMSKPSCDLRFGDTTSSPSQA